jgi:hypothetical protein
MDQIPFQSLLDQHVDSVMKGSTAKKNKPAAYQRLLISAAFAA